MLEEELKRRDEESIKKRKKEWRRGKADLPNITNITNSLSVNFQGFGKLFNWTYGVLLSIQLAVTILQLFGSTFREMQGDSIFKVLIMNC